MAIMSYLNALLPVIGGLLAENKTDNLPVQKNM